MNINLNVMTRDDLDKKLNTRYRFQSKNEFLLFSCISWMWIRDNFDDIKKAKDKFKQVIDLFKLKDLTPDNIEEYLEQYCSHAFGDGDIDKMTDILIKFVHHFFKNDRKGFLNFFHVYNNTGTSFDL